jgi:hypothetical protein
MKSRGAQQKLKTATQHIFNATPASNPQTPTRMSLAEFIAATQAEMKSRIEEECRRQMLALLEDSFSRKWTEYTDKAVTSASATPLYTEGYGRLNIDSIPETGDLTAAVKPILKAQQELFKFSSKSVYFIHCCVKMRQDNHSGGSSTSIEAYLIDNYGFHYQISAAISGGSHRYPNTPMIIDITKPIGAEKYIYPLSNTLIDMVKALPYSVTHSYNNSNNSTYNVSGGDLQSLIKNLPEIRKAAAAFNEQTVAFDALRKENEALKARLRALEAASPSEDLLGLEAATEAAALTTEPSRD